MQNNFKIGDFVELTDPQMEHECPKTQRRSTELIALEITAISGEDNTMISGARWIGKDSEILGSICCSLTASRYRRVSAKGMRTLTNLTDGQRAGLSKEDQALRELGVINDTLDFIDEKYVIAHYFKTNRAVIAAQAIKDVAEIKAELKKTSK